MIVVKEFKNEKGRKNTDPEFREYNSRVREGGKSGELGSKEQMHEVLWDEG